ncbi:MAG TPA: cytochrome c oxidase subunit II [Candidatus Acidoferrum sp.]|nr:cytochrome c oxidase subunit II [Candidatus Acidoferrum sp.]
MLPTLSINTISSFVKAARRQCVRWTLAVAALLASPALLADWTLNMREGVTEISRETHHLHMTVIYICVAIGIVVYGVLIYSLIAYRKSRGAVPAKFSHNTTAEIIWTIIPFVILIAMAIPSTRVLMEIYDNKDSSLDIMVTGYQWRWQYKYMSDKGAPVVYFSNLATPQEQIQNYPGSISAEKGEHYLLEVDEPLVIPVGKKVRFLLTSADVIHAWWMPDFAIKKDAIPGFVNEASVIAEKPGIYRGQCAELCGRNHGFMPIVVEVKEQADFDAWYAEKQAAAQKVADMTNQQFSMAELMEKGQTVYTTYCQACHQPNGQGLPPTFPALAGSKIANGPIEGHLERVIRGKTGTAMAAFGAQLSPVDIAAVITFERNSFGNKMGDMATPLQVFQMEQAK